MTLKVTIIGDNPVDFLAKLRFVADAYLGKPIATELAGGCDISPFVPGVIERAQDDRLKAEAAAEKPSDGSALVETLNENTPPVEQPVEVKAKEPVKAPRSTTLKAPRPKPEPVAEVEGAEVIDEEPTEEKLTIEDIKGLARGVLGSHPDGITAVRGAVAQITGTPGQVSTVPSVKWPALAAALRARLNDVTNV